MNVFQHLRTYAFSVALTALLVTPMLAQDAAVPIVLATGPVHEAVAATDTVTIESTVRVSRQPPTEIPDGERPLRKSSDAVWIEGYWEWFQDRREFVWLPGIWRRPPAGLTWKPGKWVPSPDGAVRYPGYWYDDQKPPTIMRDLPPNNREFLRDGGRTATHNMLGADGFWARGSWSINAEGKFLWQPGYVAAAEPGYQWQAGRVVPVQGGYAVTVGYFDVTPSQRGQVFAAIRPAAVATTESPKPKFQPKSVPIELSSITRSPQGQWHYMRLRNSNSPDSAQKKEAQPLHRTSPRRLNRDLALDGLAMIQGVVHKGKLTPHSIEIKIVGGVPQITHSDDQGRFVFKDVPFGVYSLLAEGPVQNNSRHGAIELNVEQVLVTVDIELE